MFDQSDEALIEKIKTAKNKNTMVEKFNLYYQTVDSYTITNEFSLTSSIFINIILLITFILLLPFL